MRTYRKVPVGLLVACAIAALGLAGCSTDRKPRLSGTVTLDGEPVADAEVSLMVVVKGRPTRVKYAWTDSGGQYEIRNVTPRAYRVVIRKYLLSDGSPAKQEHAAMIAMSRGEGLRSVLPDSYGDPTQTSLAVEIKDKSQTENFALANDPPNRSD